MKKEQSEESDGPINSVFVNLKESRDSDRENSGGMKK